MPAYTPIPSLVHAAKAVLACEFSKKWISMWPPRFTDLPDHHDWPWKKSDRNSEFIYIAGTRTWCTMGLGANTQTGGVSVGDGIRRGKRAVELALGLH